MAVSCGVGSRTSSSSVTPRAAPRRCMRCCGATPDLHARAQGAALSASSPGRSRRPARASSRLRTRCHERSMHYLALFDGALPEQRAGEASSSYLRSPDAPRSHRADGSRRADHRDPARARQLPALAAPAASAGPRRERARPAPGAALEREDDRAATGAPAAALRYSDHVRYVEQLRRYHEFFAARAVLVLIYDDFRARTRRRCGGCCASSRWTTTWRSSRYEANPTVRMRSVRLAQLLHAARTGQGPFGRAVNGPLEALTPRRVRRAALGVVRRRVLYGEPHAPDERLMGELRAAFQAGGGGAE